MKIKIRKEFTCIRCSHKWNPKVDKPQECPKCKTRYWKEGVKQ